MVPFDFYAPAGRAILDFGDVHLLGVFSYPEPMDLFTT